MESLRGKALFNINAAKLRKIFSISYFMKLLTMEDSFIRNMEVLEVQERAQNEDQLKMNLAQMMIGNRRGAAR